MTREDINIEYPKRGSAIITVVLAKLPNVVLTEKPVGLRLR